MSQRTAPHPKTGEEIPVFELKHDVTTPEGKAAREALKAHGTKPCFFDYGAGSALGGQTGLMYVENPKGGKA